MTAEQQELFLRAAVDALEDIRADEVKSVSAEIRRSITRPNQIVPEIAKLVADRRERARRAKEQQAWAEEAARHPPPAPPAPTVSKPMTEDEIRRMPKWLRDMGLRVGFLKREGGNIVEA
jgi:hypothetical protein